MEEKTTAEAKKLPQHTKTLIAETMRELETLQALVAEKQRRVQMLVAAAREMLNVPEDWSIYSVEEGFVPPQRPEPPVTPPVTPPEKEAFHDKQ